MVDTLILRIQEGKEKEVTINGKKFNGNIRYLLTDNSGNYLWGK